MLEYDDARSGTFEALADVPNDKTVVLGLVTTKNASLESVDELRSRVADAARHFPLAQLGVSPQCGFATSIVGNNLGMADQERKLALVAETARSVWG